MPTPSPRKVSNATRAESTRLRTAVSVTSITIRAGSTPWAARVSLTPLSHPGAASWTGETLTLIGPGRSDQRQRLAGPAGCARMAERRQGHSGGPRGRPRPDRDRGYRDRRPEPGGLGPSGVGD